MTRDKEMAKKHRKQLEIQFFKEYANVYMKGDNK